MKVPFWLRKQNKIRFLYLTVGCLTHRLNTKRKLFKFKTFQLLLSSAVKWEYSKFVFSNKKVKAKFSTGQNFSKEVTAHFYFIFCNSDVLFEFFLLVETSQTEIYQNP